MKLKKIKISELNKAKYNPRVMTEEARASLEKSIEEFGLVEPIIWNKQTGNVVGGHQRLDVLIKQGTKETDVVEVNLTEDKEKLLNLALNKTIGDWDYNKLTNLFKGLNEVANINDLDLTLSGFTDNEISSLIDSDSSLLDIEEDKIDTKEFSNKDKEIEDNNLTIHISFSNKDNADKFLTKLGIENKEFHNNIKIIDGDNL